MRNQKTGSFKIIIFLIIFSLVEMYDQPFDKKWNIDIVYIGNSITKGSLLGIPEEESPPATSSDYIRRQPGVGEVRFINEGRTGYTAADYLPSDTGALSQVIYDTHKFHKDQDHLLLFTISLGTDDNYVNDSDTIVEPTEYQSNLKAIADKLLSEFPGCKIIFLQPVWFSPDANNSPRYMTEGLARLQTYFPELQSLVLKYSQSKPGQIFLGDLKGFAYFRNNYLTDLIPEEGNAGSFYLHPNKKGANVLGKLWGEAIYESIFKHSPAV